MTPYVSDIMDINTLTALEASIEHWTRHATRTAAKYEGIMAEHCDLCFKFYDLNCAGCPVLKRTGRLLCKGSPWYEAKHHFNKVLSKAAPALQSPQFVEAANAELAFLKSLLPERYQPVQPITTMLPLL